MSDEQGVSIHSGFPNPATDQTMASLDLQQLLIKHPVSTFFMQIDGDTWAEQGIFNGDIVLIDRALAPRKTDYVVWWEAENFVISKPKDVPENISMWGVVSAVIHRFRT